MELHALRRRVTALNQLWAAVDVHQALVVVVIDGGAENAHIEQLSACVVHVLKHNNGGT